jgi:hypothetical protein
MQLERAVKAIFPATTSSLSFFIRAKRGAIPGHVNGQTHRR